MPEPEMIDVFLRSLFERALESDFGVAIETKSTEALRRRCYAMRKLLVDEGRFPMRFIKVSISPDGTEVWLVKHVEGAEGTRLDSSEDRNLQ